MKTIFRDIKLSNKRIKKNSAVIGRTKSILYELLPRGTELSVNVQGIDLIVRCGTPDLYVAIESITGEYTFLCDYLPRDYDGVIIDAGAYIGSAAIVFANSFPHARIVCIEPSKNNFGLLQRNTALYSNIEIRKVALAGSHEGPLSLRNRGTGEWGFTVIDRPIDNVDAVAIEQVDTIDIGTLLADFSGKVGFLKLDIEGAEKEVFQSTSVLLSEVPYVFVELHENIVSGCVSSFEKFSFARDIRKFGGEKYLSMKKDITLS
ncbi:FkbM family methyltransferase [Agrobacterium larrymoorei]|uniref:FkbM family methyltransferase n=1 Tax=Agrobacterium larrymoorei TaxID=160699 RepID=UPI0030BA42F1